MTTKFFLCTTCGNVIVKVVDSGVIPVCCGKQMKELVPVTVETFAEKHLPVVEQIDSAKCIIRVKVGSKPHPMSPEHFIGFVYLETENGGMMHYLTPADEVAEVTFCTCADKPVAVYAYCNIHGLWKTDVTVECECPCQHYF